MLVTKNTTQNQYLETCVMLFMLCSKPMSSFSSEAVVGGGNDTGLFEALLSIFFIPAKENILRSYKEKLFSAQYLLLLLNQ